MLGIYIVLALAGVYFMIESLFLTAQIQWKTFIQALLMLGIGGGGMWLSFRRKK
jgi:hypothetical protein